MKMIAKTFHDQAYEFYPWEMLGEDIFALAKQVIDSGEKFDRIVALAKGGLTFSRSLVDFLAVKSVSSIQIEFYTGIGTTSSTPVITQCLPVSIAGERVLIFDDIADQGETLSLAKQYMGQHGAKEIKTAVLIQKPWTKIKADFVARESQAWVIFPNEIRETITTLKELWAKKGDDLPKIKNQLLELGFSEAEVALFLSAE